MTALRRPWVWVAVAAVLVAGYLVSPLIAAANLAHAVKARDIKGVMARVEPGPLRRSLTRQLVRGYIVLNKKEGELGALGQQVAIAMGVTVFDPILEQMTTPNAIADLLRRGWPLAGSAPAASDATIDIDGFMDLLGHLDDVTFVSPTEFRLVVNIDGTPERRLGWRLRLQGITWKLYSVDLSPALVEKIVARMPTADKLEIENPFVGKKRL